MALFESGKSGNPGGRPKMDPELKAMFQAKGLDAYQRIVQLMNSDNEKVALTAAQTLLERAYGKVPQALIGGDEDDPAIRTISKVIYEIVGTTPSGS